MRQPTSNGSCCLRWVRIVVDGHVEAIDRRRDGAGARADGEGHNAKDGHHSRRYVLGIIQYRNRTAQQPYSTTRTYRTTHLQCTTNLQYSMTIPCIAIRLWHSLQHDHTRACSHAIILSSQAPCGQTAWGHGLVGRQPYHSGDPAVATRTSRRGRWSTFSSFASLNRNGF